MERKRNKGRDGSTLRGTRTDIRQRERKGGGGGIEREAGNQRVILWEKERDSKGYSYRQTGLELEKHREAKTNRRAKKDRNREKKKMKGTRERLSLFTAILILAA